ncbi:16S rRNA (cytidine(1402)-2'-O)-methyltransferase [Alteraurantiacibacter aestuarii]|uniref:16S rRNA (cytidine(1402)-2'-O)-methyltransferase n=1 Tax=Alteraurantiacibacter aestuarii TaxID=650004 RepID=UPI0031CE2334
MTDASEPQKLDPGLYIVATPIGNLGDITLRAKDVLARCDAVACEDTRVTGKLLKLLGLSARLWRHDDHASSQDRARLIENMHHQAIALVSDAGMPLVSDPGYRLVRDAREAGITITALPGASAPLLALAVSGLPNDRFLFAGFLPPKDKARRDMLEELAGIRSTLIFFETAPRLIKSLEAINDVLPGREVAVARELTKMHEECRTALPAELIAHYTAYPPRGEIVLVVGPPGDVDQRDMDIDALLLEALADHKPSQAAAQVAKLSGQDRRELYARALELRGQ